VQNTLSNDLSPSLILRNQKAVRGELVEPWTALRQAQGERTNKRSPFRKGGSQGIISVHLYNIIALNSGRNIGLPLQMEEIPKCLCTPHLLIVPQCRGTVHCARYRYRAQDASLSCHCERSKAILSLLLIAILGLFVFLDKRPFR